LFLAREGNVRVALLVPKGHLVDAHLHRFILGGTIFVDHRAFLDVGHV
jgi:hypothetical protein